MRLILMLSSTMRTSGRTSAVTPIKGFTTPDTGGKVPFFEAGVEVVDARKNEKRGAAGYGVETAESEVVDVFENGGEVEAIVVEL
jgi:hypothetical protein